MFTPWLIGVLAATAFSVVQDSGTVPVDPIIQTADPDAMGRCLNGLAGFRRVQVRCVVDGEGLGRDCEVLNPTPAVMRREYVFQCMASKIRFTYPDGSPAEGVTVHINLGGRTVLGEGELDRERRAASQPDQ